MMQNLTPFVRHALENAPDTAGAPGPASSRSSPPLGEPPASPENPGIQLPPPQLPTQGQTPHPDGIPVTDGTPLPCHQKNAAEFLRGRSPGVMAQYAQGLFGTQQHTQSAHPAPEQATQAVRELVEWREEAPYG